MHSGFIFTMSFIEVKYCKLSRLNKIISTRSKTSSCTLRLCKKKVRAIIIFKDKFWGASF